MRWRSMIALALVAGLVAPGVAAAQDTRPGVGIFAFENGGSYGQEAEDFEALQVGLQQMLIGDLSGNSGLRLVERGQIQALLDEQDLGAGGRVDASTAAQIGRLIGARYMIFGSFIDFYGDFRLDARIIDGETGEVIKTDRARGPRDGRTGRGKTSSRYCRTLRTTFQAVLNCPHSQREIVKPSMKTGNASGRRTLRPYGHTCGDSCTRTAETTNGLLSCSARRSMLSRTTMRPAKL